VATGVNLDEGEPDPEVWLPFFNRPGCSCLCNEHRRRLSEYQPWHDGSFTNGPNPSADKNTGNALAILLDFLAVAVVNQPSLELTYRDSYYAWYGQDDWRVRRTHLEPRLRTTLTSHFRERRTTLPCLTLTFQIPWKFHRPQYRRQTLDQAWTAAQWRIRVCRSPYRRRNRQPARTSAIFHHASALLCAEFEVWFGEAAPAGSIFRASAAFQIMAIAPPAPVSPPCSQASTDQSQSGSHSQQPVFHWVQPGNWQHTGLLTGLGTPVTEAGWRTR